MTKTQYIGDGSAENLPEPARSRLLKTFEQAQYISDEADAILVTQLNGTVSFQYKSSCPLPLMNAFERAQSICFVTKYNHLPIFNKLDIVEENGKHYLGNVDYIRHILNEYRSIVKNQRDSVYYSKIHKFCREKLANKEPSKGMSVRVSHDTDGDVTDVLLKIIDQRNKAIKIIIKACDYDYIYDGILQHSDHSYANRLIEEYHTGHINHIFIKHAFLLGKIKDLMYWHYYILNNLTYPKLGPL